MELNKMFFKVKKVILDGVEYIGIVLPVYNNSIIESDRFKIHCLNGNIIKQILVINAKISTTRITNKKIRSLADELILLEKDKFKLIQERINLKELLKKRDSNIYSLEDKVELKSKELVNAQGYLTNYEFTDEIMKNLRLEDVVSIELKNDNNNNLTEICYIKEVLLGKYLKDGDYPFFYTEYDGYLMESDDFLTNKTFIKLKEKYYKEPNKKLFKYPLTSQYDICTGDKNSGYMYHYIYINKLDIEMKECNLKKVFNIINTLLNDLKK